MEKQKKVGCLYRVSTTMQATRHDREETDIPTQRTACRRFIEQHPAWVLEKEYVEIGVSGFKNSISERDKLLEVKEDIANGIIHVLLVFMFDRVGRIEEETPLVVKSFVDMGAEVWSVREGQRKFDEHIDGLINYLTFWQAAGESKKTSERVANAMTQMAEQGMYTGGRCPYGYKAVDTGRLTKKKIPERKLVIDEGEAAVVKKVYGLALNSGFGCHRIARILNEAGVTTRYGSQWGSSAVSNMLNNPIYKGVKAYGRTTAKGKGKRQIRLPQEEWTIPETNPELIIIPPDDWENVYRRRKKAAMLQKAQKEHNESLPDTVYIRGRLLFAGYAYCGECGSKMITGYSPYRWKTEDGVVHRRDHPVYRCCARASGKIGCPGKSSYARDKVDPVIAAEIKKFLRNISTMELSEEVLKLRKENAATETRRIKKLEKELREVQKNREALEKEVVMSLRGEGTFEPDLISRLLSENQERFESVKNALAEAEQLLEKKTLEYDNLTGLQETVPVWSDIFDSATLDEQRVMLARMIEKVTLGPKGVTVDMRLHINEFLGYVCAKPVSHKTQKAV